MGDIRPRDLRFVLATEHAVDAMWAIGLDLCRYADDVGRDVSTQYRLQDLSCVAMTASMRGILLIGEQSRDARQDIREALSRLPAICEELIDCALDMDEFDVLEFVGQVCDVHRGLLHLGLLPKPTIAEPPPTSTNNRSAAWTETPEAGYLDDLEGKHDGEHHD